MEIQKGDEFELTRETMELFLDGELEEVPIDKIRVVAETTDENFKVDHLNPDGENVKTLTVKKRDIEESVREGIFNPK